MTLDVNSARLLHKALTATGDELLVLLEQAPLDLVQAALKNPALGESHLLLLLKRPDLGEEHLKGICKLAISESSHTLKLAIARHPSTPAHQLLSILPHLYLFELLNFCYVPGITPDQKLAAERNIIQRLPLIPLGNKLTLARRATTVVLEALLKEGDPRVVELCLANPHLKEGAVFQFLRSAAAKADTISLVARNPRWQKRPNLREAILTNPRTPMVWFTLWLPSMGRGDLKRLIASSRLNPQQKKAVEDRLRQI
ncbi:MAG TPA: hypothetical protein VFF53_01845 [Geobacteraceae bacterium]|nr:hypothetical protein [Geobacteraceae bacterium]